MVIGVLTGGGFEDGRPEPGRGEHESATLEVRGSHSATAGAGGTDVTASSAAVTVPFASSEDDRNLQTVSISSHQTSLFITLRVISY